MINLFFVGLNGFNKSILFEKKKKEICNSEIIINIKKLRKLVLPKYFSISI